MIHCILTEHQLPRSLSFFLFSFFWFVECQLTVVKAYRVITAGLATHTKKTSAEFLRDITADVIKFKRQLMVENKPDE